MFAIFSPKEKEGDIVTIPYSCNDLNIIGHELNGIYLVKEKNSSKIRIVYCDFSPLADQLRGMSSKGLFRAYHNVYNLYLSYISYILLHQ